MQTDVSYHGFSNESPYMFIMKRVTFCPDYYKNKFKIADLLVSIETS